MSVSDKIKVSGVMILFLSGLALFSGISVTYLSFLQGQLSKGKIFLSSLLLILSGLLLFTGFGIINMYFWARRFILGWWTLAIFISFLFFSYMLGPWPFLLTEIVVLPCFIYYLFSLWFFNQVSIREQFGEKRDKRRYAFQDRRMSKRFGGSAKVTYRLLQEPLIEGEALVRDVSLRGIRLSLDKKLPLDIPLELKIFIEEDSRPIFVIGEVVWLKEIDLGKGKFEVGIKFTDVDTSDRLRLISRYIYGSVKRLF